MTQIDCHNSTCLHQLAISLTMGKMLSLVLVWTSCLCSSVLSGCPDVKNEGLTRFTREMGSIDMVAVQKYIELPCCAAGYDNITWHRLEAGTWKEFPPPLGPGSYLQPRTSQDGQVLVIPSAKMGDSTTYKCEIIKDSTPRLQHSIQLKVEACDAMPRGPIMTYPFPVNQTVEELGGKVVFHCTGYFGCDNSEIRVVEWRLNKREIGHANISRYNVTEIKRERADWVQSVLVISPVQVEDLHKQFECYMTSPQIINPEQSTVVTISKREKPEKQNLTVVIVVSVVGAIGLVAIIIGPGCWIKKLYGPQIALFYHSRYPKPINEDGLEHNVFVYHADDDQGVAEKIKEKLVEKNYNISMTSDVRAGRVEFTQYADECKKSAVVVFLYSQNLREDRWFPVFLPSLIMERKGERIIIVEIEEFVPKDMKDWTEEQRDKDKRDAENGGANGDLDMNGEGDDAVRADHGANDGHGPNNGDANEPDHNDACPDLKYWKTLPRLKFPPEDASIRKQKNFWASLFNKIPKFSYQIQADRNRHDRDIERGGRGRVSSSGQRLLQEEPRTPSPTDVENIVTPNTDEVFTYDDDMQTEVKQTVEPIPHGQVQPEVQQNTEPVPHDHMGVRVERNVQENRAFLRSHSSSEGTENETGATSGGTENESGVTSGGTENESGVTSVGIDKPAENQAPRVLVEIHNSNEANSEMMFTMSGDETEVKRRDSEEAEHSHKTTSPERSDSKDSSTSKDSGAQFSPVSSISAPPERSDSKDSSTSKDSGAQFSPVSSISAPPERSDSKDSSTSKDSGAQYSQGSSVSSPVSSPESGYASYLSGNTQSGQDMFKRGDRVSEQSHRAIPGSSEPSSC